MDGARRRTLPRTYNINRRVTMSTPREKSSSLGTAADRPWAGIGGRGTARGLRSAGARRAAASASCLCTAAASSGLRGAGRRCRSAGERTPAAFAGLWTAALPRRRLPVDAGILGLGRWRLLLGTRNLGTTAARRRALDPRLLGLRGRSVCVSYRLLGTARRLLRRVNYGFGYVGTGFAAADGPVTRSRTTVRDQCDVTNIHNTYNTTVINNVTVNKVSYNGGAGGVAAAPTAQERAAAQEPHVAPTPLQRQHVQEASRNPALAARANGGPSVDRRDAEARSVQCAGSGRCAWRGYAAKDARRRTERGDACARRRTERDDARSRWRPNGMNHPPGTPPNAGTHAPRGTGGEGAAQAGEAQGTAERRQA